MKIARAIDRILEEENPPLQPGVYGNPAQLHAMTGFPGDPSNMQWQTIEEAKEKDR